MTEEWRAVAGWEGVYEVSDLGRVRSLPRLTSSRPGRTKRLPGRVLRPSPTTRGYLLVIFSRGTERHPKKVHRLVLETFVGPCPEGMEGAHENGVKTDNRAANLRWKTRSENAKDRTRHGTQAGFKNRRAA